MKSLFSIIFAFMIFLNASISHAEEELVLLTSLNWLPYTGTDLKNGGPITHAVRQAFTAAGYKVKILFYPWKRATNSVKNVANHMAYFPGYRSKTAESAFLISEPFGDSPMGLMTRSDITFSEEDLNNLPKYRVGVVAGYINTADFDAAVRAGKQNTEVSPDDTTLIKKIAEGRVKLGIIDKNVMQYLLDHEPKLAAYKNKIKFVKTLESKKLHLCFKKSDQGLAMMKAFNKGLKIIKDGADELTISFDLGIEEKQKS